MTLPAVGARLSHFELVAELGRGGMGVVYEARDTRLGRRVAIKTIHAAFAPGSTAHRRFVMESRATARLRHPYICQVFDVLEVDGEELIVMELLEGESLQKRLSRGRFEIADALRLATEAAEALREAHAHGIVHRDIKPSNLFLLESGHVKLLDFGIARTIAEAGGTTRPSSAEGPLTEPHGIVGTVGYMSPEQALGKPVDARADIFALGVVLFEMVGGAHPFAAEGLAPYLYKLFTQPAPPLSRFRPEAPVELDALLAAMLAGEPEARPSRMEDVYRRLVEIASGAAAAAPTSPPRTRYARRDGINIAYQVLGDGPVDVVYVPGWVTHLEYGWEEPRVARFFRQLAASHRLVLLDKRGTGLSDRGARYPTLEDRMDDVRAVMDAVGSERAVIFGVSEGGNMAALFAATYPERTVALVTFGVFAKRIHAEDYPWAPTRAVREAWLETLAAEWGGPVDLETLAPSLADDARFREWWAAYLRLSASPGAALELARFNTEIDVRGVLPAIRVPALVLHRSGDRDVLIAEGRYIAERIPGATFRELPGDDHLVYAGAADDVVRIVEDFLHSLPPRQMEARRFRAVLSVRTGAPADTDTANAILDRLLAEFLGVREPASDRWIRASFDGPGRAIRCGAALAAAGSRVGIDVRVGIHVGEVDTSEANVAESPSRVADAVAEEAGVREVLVTGAVRALVAGAGLRFDDRGVHRGAAGTFPVAAVVSVAELAGEGRAAP